MKNASRVSNSKERVWTLSQSFSGSLHDFKRLVGGQRVSLVRVGGEWIYLPLRVGTPKMSLVLLALLPEASLSSLLFSWESLLSTFFFFWDPPAAQGNSYRLLSNRTSIIWRIRALLSRQWRRRAWAKSPLCRLIPSHNMGYWVSKALPFIPSKGRSFH